MLYGNKLTLPYEWKVPAKFNDIDKDVTQRVQSVKILLPEICNFGFNNMLKVKNCSTERYNKSVQHIEGAHNKFDPVWEGPYRVIRVYTNEVYQIVDTNGNKDSVTGDRLKTYAISIYMLPGVSEKNNIRSGLHRAWVRNLSIGNLEITFACKFTYRI
ncbi:hypothetical protein BB558_000777 [Smittium angustum]|uniref:Uncharacterized protein n=1 Tax=Smittium angustum TaxID=133377 RepID=A0A2U1JD71_SMIAN|nr:hypothetical protein BB558_000777 [Smittium angustum]